jgi:RNA polymerase-binding transcription factor DksA
METTMTIDVEKQKRIMQERLAYYRETQKNRTDDYKAFKLKFSIPNTERALAKIEAGTYGFCEGCGERISDKRLEKVPAALRCAACQSDVERGEARRR